jgi:hypothetical protein
LRFFNKWTDKVFVNDSEVAVLTSEVLRLHKMTIDVLKAENSVATGFNSTLFAKAVMPDFLKWTYDPPIGNLGHQRRTEMRKKLLLSTHQANFALSIDELLQDPEKPLSEREVLFFVTPSFSSEEVAIFGDGKPYLDCGGDFCLYTPGVVLSVDFNNASLGLALHSRRDNSHPSDHPWQTWPDLGAAALSRRTDPDAFWAEVREKVEGLLKAMQTEEDRNDKRRFILLGDDAGPSTSQLKQVLSGILGPDAWMMEQPDSRFIASLSAARSAGDLQYSWLESNEGHIYRNMGSEGQHEL